MKRRPTDSTPSLFLTVITSFALLMTSASFAMGANGMHETQNTDDSHDQQNASIWGDKMVYDDERNGDLEIYLYDLYTGEETRITDDAADQQDPAIYGDTIVWTDRRNGNRDIYLYDLSSAEETRVTSASADQEHPAIHGNFVAWADYRSGSDADVWYFDLSNGSSIKSLVAGGPEDQDYPDVFGERIVYENWNTPSGDADVNMWDRVTDVTTRITDESKATKWLDDQCAPRIWGDTVVWEDHRGSEVDIWSYEISTGAETRCTDSTSTQKYPAVYRDLVTYHDDWNGSEDIYCLDMSTGIDLPVTNIPQDQRYPDVWGNKIVWQDFRNSNDWDIWMSTMPLVPKRSGGATRYDTAAMVSANHFAGASTVVIATGAGFADALAASGLAGCYGGPLLLTNPDSLSTAATTEIQRLGATKAVIVGGEGAVSKAVKTDLEDLGLVVERLGGATRYETAAMIADRIDTLTGSAFEKTAFVARGDSFPDALAVSPLAYYNRFPILLTHTDALPATTEDALDDLDIETAVIVGGSGAVSDDTKDAIDDVLAANGSSSSKRWAGATRYETAVEVAENACDRYWAGRGFVGVAVGSNFPDALAGGAAAGREFGVLLLVQQDALPTAAAEFLTDSGDAIGQMEVFGGTGAVSDVVVDDIAQSLE